MQTRRKRLMWVLLRGGVFETSVLQAIRNDSRTFPDFTQVNNTYQNGLGYISDTYPNPYPLLTVPPL